MNLKLHISVLVYVFLIYPVPPWVILALMGMARSRVYHWAAVSVYGLTIWYIVLKLISQWR